VNAVHDDEAVSQPDGTWAEYPASVQRDLAAYERMPPDEDERALGNLPVTLDLGDDDVDYDALYAQEP
jgi:hypothetical protein